MRAKDFITKAASPEQIQQLLTDCSDYFTTLGRSSAQYVLLRGEKRPGFADSFIKNQRNVLAGRKPVDTPEVIHDKFNELFSLHCGYPFRSGVMCTASYGQADEYGKPHIIVPCNGFTMCYSPEFTDLYTDAINDDIKELEILSYNDETDQYKSKFENENRLNRLIQMQFKIGKYKEGIHNLKQAILSKNEIMLYPINGSTLEFYLFSYIGWRENVIPMLPWEYGGDIKK